MAGSNHDVSVMAPLGAPTSPSAHTSRWRSAVGGSDGSVVEDVWCGGSGLAAGSLMPLEGIRRGRRSAARLRVLLSGAWRPRTRSEVRWGSSRGSVLADV